MCRALNAHRVSGREFFSVDALEEATRLIRAYRPESSKRPPRRIQLRLPKALIAGIDDLMDWLWTLPELQSVPKTRSNAVLYAIERGLDVLEERDLTAKNAIGSEA